MTMEDKIKKQDIHIFCSRRQQQLSGLRRIEDLGQKELVTPIHTPLLPLQDHKQSFLKND